MLYRPQKTRKNLIKQFKLPSIIIILCKLPKNTNIIIVMSLSSQIVRSLQAALVPETAKRATEEIQKLRRYEGYLRTLLRLLVDDPPQALILSLLSQVKVFSNQNTVSESDIQFIKKIFFNIVKRHANSKTHKLLRVIVNRFTQNYADKWLNKSQYEEELNSDNDTLEWFISVLIGVCEANQFANYFNKISNLSCFDTFFYLLIKKTQQCGSCQLHYIIKFFKKYILSCSPKQAHDKVQEILKFMKIGNKLWRTTTKQNEESEKQEQIQMSKCRKWLLKLIQMWILKESEYGKHIDKTYDFQIWQHLQVQNFIQQILQKYNESNPYSKQYCFAPIMIGSVKTLIEFTRLGQHKIMVPYVQKMLYINIPKLLYKLKEIILCNGVVLNMLDDTNKDQINLKVLLLTLWRELSMIDINELHYKEVRSLNIMLKKLSISSPQQTSNKLVQQLLPTFHLHWKFLFQKLSETQTFFSSFSYRKELNDQSIWDFKDQSWAIVLFDLLKASYLDLEKDQNLQLKKNVSVILLSYILPKLSRPHPLLQAQTLATASTLWRQFQCLHIPSNIIDSFTNLLDQNTDEDVKDVLLRILPSLAGNAQINYLVRQNIDKIVNLYINILCQEAGNFELSNSFKKIFDYFGPNLQNPTQYFNKLTRDFFKQDLNKINFSGYVDCIESCLELCSKQEHYPKIRHNFLRIVEYTLNFRKFDLNNPNSNQADQFIQSDLMKVVGKYIHRVEQLNEQLMMIFGVYCFSVSGFNHKILGMMNQKSRRVVKSFAANNQPCEKDCLLGMLYVLQMFSIHSNFDFLDDFVGAEPISLYIQTLNACYQQFGVMKQEESQIYLDLQISILNSCISLTEDFYDSAAVNESVMTQSNFVDIWELAIGFIYEQNKEQLLLICKNSPEKNQQTQSDDEQHWSLLSRKFQLIILKNKIIQFLSDIIWLNPLMSSICFQQTPNLTEAYIHLIQHTNPSKELGKNHVLRVIYGLSSTINFDHIQAETLTRIINCLSKYFLFEVNKQLKSIRSYGNAYRVQSQLKNNYENDDQSQWQIEQEQSQADLTQYKKYVVFDETNYVEEVQEFIEILRQNHPQVVKMNKQVILKMKKAIKEMNQICQDF